MVKTFSIKKICRSNCSLVKIAGIIMLTLFSWHACGEKTVVKDDITPPIILLVPAVIAADSTALIYWETDEPCSARVVYALVGSNDTLRVTTNEFRQHQEVRLSHLLPNSEYYFYTCSYDAYGNLTLTSPQAFQTAIDTSVILWAGWQAYVAKDYATALTNFALYLSYRPADLAGLTAYGWAQVRIDSLISGSIMTFGRVLEIKNDECDALAGLSLAYYRLRNWPDLVQVAENLLTINNQYVFQYDNKIGAGSVRLMLAEAYLSLTMWTEAQAQLDILLPQNGLSASDSTTWTVGDSSYSWTFATYEEALRGWIEYLKWNYWESGIPKRASSPAFWFRRYYQREIKVF